MFLGKDSTRVGKDQPLRLVDRTDDTDGPVIIPRRRRRRRHGWLKRALLAWRAWIWE